MTNTVLTSDALLPFIETDQYIDFVDTCEYTRKMKRMALIFGYAGAGKTASALRYRAEQPLITANGQSPVLYFQLTRSDTNHRAFNNRVVEAITRLPNQNRTSAAALAEAKRLIKKYGYALLIVDEVGFLDESGLEAARTLYDETDLPIVFITMPHVYKRIEAEERYDTFYSRLADVREFGLLTVEHIKTIILPNLSPESHLRFDISRSDAKAMAQELFIGCGGTELRGARFREVAQILERCNDLIQESCEIREQYLRSNLGDLPPPVRSFNTDLIRESVRRSKRRSAQPAAQAKPE
jgi:hypothetical protein